MDGSLRSEKNGRGGKRRERERERERERGICICIFYFVMRVIEKECERTLRLRANRIFR